MHLPWWLLFIFPCWVLGVSEPSPEGSSAPLTAKEAVILGTVQGVTEFLPVSSSGHLMLAIQAMKIPKARQNSRILGLLCILFQGASACVVPWVLRRRLKDFLPGLLWKKLFLIMFLGTFPAATLGFLLKDFTAENPENSLKIVSYLLPLGGLYMGLVELWRRRNRPTSPQNSKSWTTLSWREALFVGLMQCVALCPGVSRSMMTLTAGVLLGLPLAECLELSLLLGFVIVSGVSGYALIKNWELDPSVFYPLSLGSLAAFLAGLSMIYCAIKLIKNYGLMPFVFYRIAIGVFLLAVL